MSSGLVFPPPPAFELRVRLGPLLLGTWLAVGLSVITAIQGLKYYTVLRMAPASTSQSTTNRLSNSAERRKSRPEHPDPGWLRIMVAVLLGLCTLSLLDFMVMDWLYLVAHWGETLYLLKQPWTCE